MSKRLRVCYKEALERVKEYEFLFAMGEIERDQLDKAVKLLEFLDNLMISLDQKLAQYEKQARDLENWRDRDPPG